MPFLKVIVPRTRDVVFVSNKKLVIDTVVRSFTPLIILGALTLAVTVAAAPQGSELQEKLAAVKRVAAENTQKLHQYQWIETTQLTLKGDTKPATEYSCRYGPDGQVQKMPIGSPPQQPSGGRVKRELSRRKKRKLETTSKT